MNNPPRILIVEDEAPLRENLTAMLTELGYDTMEAADGLEGLEVVAENEVDLVITDVNMPRMDGIKLTSTIREDRNTRLLPVIILTGSTGFDNRVKGIEAGADDFLAKPFQYLELKARVAALLKIKNFTDDLEDAEEVIFSLAVAADAKDSYTQDHCYRLSTTGVEIGKRMGLDDETIQAIRRGGILHDIGKIGVPDSILQKNGKLTEEEWVVIRSHPIKGEEICKPLRSLASALPIIRGHHERMDGKGYPDGLEGDEIPIGARIIAAVDFFDAITTDRPYRNASDHNEAEQMTKDEVKFGHLDGTVVDELLKLVRENRKGLIGKSPYGGFL